MRELQELKYYNNKDNGGWSPCIEGNRNKLPRDNRYNVLGNCVGWSVGRFNEFSNQNGCKLLGSRDASYLYELAKSQGLETGMTPRVGAMAVFENGGKGHVYNVERINKDKSIYDSESGWNGNAYYWHATHKAPNYNTGESWLSSYKLKGFVYQPLIKKVYNKAEIGLNIRQEPTTSSIVLDVIPFKKEINIYAIDGSWGATEIGWISLEWTQDEPIKEAKEPVNEELPTNQTGEEDTFTEETQPETNKNDQIPQVQEEVGELDYYEKKERNNPLLYVIDCIVKLVKIIKSKFKK